MADEINLEIEGVEALEKQMENLIKAVHPDKTEPVLLDAAKVIASDAKRRAPKGKTGNLRRSIVAKKTKRRGGFSATLGLSAGEAAPAITAIDFRKGPHAHLVEYGHGGPHPAPAHPFFRPAWDANKSRVEKQIVDDLTNLIDKGLA
jgi:HK97 gp10 family phage protein